MNKEDLDIKIYDVLLDLQSKEISVAQAFKIIKGLIEDYEGDNL